MKKINLWLIISALFFFVACEDYVTDLEPYNDRIVDAELNKVENLAVQIKGLDLNLNDLDDLFINADGLSDLFWFELGVIEGATYSSYEEIDNADILDDNSSSGQPYDDIHELRLYCETLIDRVNNKIEFDGSSEHEALKKAALYKANLYAGLTRYYLGAYFGKDETTGGATIDKSPFIPSNEIFDQALTYYKEAINYAADAGEIATVNSFMARLYLLKGDYANAKLFALNGLKQGDESLKLYYNTESDNGYRVAAGETRAQFAVDQRFVDYVIADPEEEKRLPLEQQEYKGNVYFIQAKYVQYEGTNVTPIEVITWQENNLILAEVAVRNGDKATADNLVNEIRASHGMTSTVSNIDLDGIMVERDKELYCTGQRLLDQRRTNTFHIAGGWQYFPIPRSEKISNPNFD